MNRAASEGPPRAHDPHRRRAATSGGAHAPRRTGRNAPASLGRSPAFRPRSRRPAPRGRCMTAPALYRNRVRVLFDFHLTLAPDSFSAPLRRCAAAAWTTPALGARRTSSRWWRQAGSRSWRASKASCACRAPARDSASRRSWCARRGGPSSRSRACRRCSANSARAPPRSSPGWRWSSTSSPPASRTCTAPCPSPASSRAFGAPSFTSTKAGRSPSRSGSSLTWRRFAMSCSSRRASARTGRRTSTATCRTSGCTSRSSRWSTSATAAATCRCSRCCTTAAEPRSPSTRRSGRRTGAGSRRCAPAAACRTSRRPTSSRGRS